MGLLADSLDPRRARIGKGIGSGVGGFLTKLTISKKRSEAMNRLRELDQTMDPIAYQSHVSSILSEYGAEPGPIVAQFLNANKILNAQARAQSQQGAQSGLDSRNKLIGLRALQEAGVPEHGIAGFASDNLNFKEALGLIPEVKEETPQEPGADPAAFETAVESTFELPTPRPGQGETGTVPLRGAGSIQEANQEAQRPLRNREALTSLFNTSEEGQKQALQALGKELERAPAGTEFADWKRDPNNPGLFFRTDRQTGALEYVKEDLFGKPVDETDPNVLKLTINGQEQTFDTRLLTGDSKDALFEEAYGIDLTKPVSADLSKLAKLYADRDRVYQAWQEEQDPRRKAELQGRIKTFDSKIANESDSIRTFKVKDPDTGEEETVIYTDSELLQSNAPKRITTVKERTLQESTKNTLQKDILGYQDILSSIQPIKEGFDSGTFDERFLTYASSIGEWINKVTERFGRAPTDAEARAYWEWRGHVQRAFDQYRRQITGMQAPMGELNKLEAAFLGSGMSASQFEANFNAITENMNMLIKIKDDVLNKRRAIGDPVEFLALDPERALKITRRVEGKFDRVEASAADEFDKAVDEYADFLDRLIDEQKITAEEAEQRMANQEQILRNRYSR